jgi:V/A-type H+-transporting ATPase subunit E
MNTKLEELTKKIYAEGIEKAQIESDQLVSNAKKQAEQIIKEAEIKAQEKLIQAEAEANSFKRNIQSEMQLAARQLVSSLKHDIQHIVKAKVIDQPLEQALSNHDTLKALLVEVVKQLNAPQETLQLNLGTGSVDLKEQLQNEIQRVLNQGIEVKSDSSINLGFKIGPKDGNYLLSFTDEDFKAWLGVYLRKETLEFLREE